MHFILATAILDFWRKPTSRDTGSGSIETLDSENMGIIVAILLLYVVLVECASQGRSQRKASEGAPV